MDSWPQEQKMGVVKQAALQGLIKAIGPLWRVCTGPGLCAPLTSGVPGLCLCKMSVGRVHVPSQKQEAGMWSSESQIIIPQSKGVLLKL